VSPVLHWDGATALSVEEFSRALEGPDAEPGEPWHATIVQVHGPSDARDLRALAGRHGVRCLDTLDRQLADFALVRFPDPRDDGRRRALTAQMFHDAGDPAACGRWAWFPWNGTLAHVLPPDEYCEVITNRNHDKITREEQARLRRRRVGVVGLSVGGEAAVTLAQEHLCGHLVLADFDRLDLSNLNRPNAGVDELGVNKAVLVARRIARINPYLSFTLFTEGVTEENMASFLEGLDLLLEECDALSLKFILRHEARRRRLNVLYAGDERGFVSVEPYASTDMAPFHGLVRERPRERAEYPGPAAFMRALTEWLGGWDQISERSRGSLARIGQDLCGYPQLASEARFAAGQLGHLARRLLLGARLGPAWIQLDLDALFPPSPADDARAE
jgi:hypothetical protein